MTAGSGTGNLLGISVLELRTDNRQLDAGLAQARANAERAGAEMQATMDRRMVTVGKSMERTGSAMSRYLTVPIVGLGVATADMAVKFQQAMEMIHTQAGASQREVNKLSGEVLNLAKTLPQSPTQLAQGLFHLESIGLRGAKAMNALKIAAQGAAVGNASLEQTATALGSAWLVNIKGAGNLHHVMGLLNATVGAGNMHMQDLVDALGTGVLPAAKLAGLSIKDVMGAMAVFTDEGYQASSAAAQFATALHFLTDPTKKANDSLVSIGMSGKQLAEDMHKPNGLLTALTDLKDHLDHLPGGIKGVPAEQVLGNIFPAGRGRVMLTLLNQLDRYSMKLGQISRNTANFSQDVAATQQTAAYKIHTAWSTIEADAIRFGDKVLPGLLSAGETIVSDADKVATAFLRLPKGAQDAIITGGIITAGIGPALKLAGVFTTGMGRLWQASRVASQIAAGKGVAAFNSQSGRSLGAAMKGAGGAGAISGVRGTELPGSAMNPIVVAIESGSMANLGSRAASIGFAEAGSSSASGAALAAGESRSAGGVILPAGTRSVEPQITATAAAQETSSGVKAGLKSGLSTFASRGMQGLMIGGIGTAVSQAVGSAVHGSVGHAIQTIGTDASIGAGIGTMFGPEGTVGGLILGGLYGTFKHFFSSESVGQQVANSLTHGFGGANRANLQKTVANAVDELNKYTTGSKTVTVAGGRFGTRQVTIPVHLSISQLSPAEQAKALKAAQTAGTAIAQQLEAGWKQYRFQSEPVMFTQLKAEMSKLPPEAQSYAIQSAVSFMQSMEKQGRVAKGSTDQFLAQVMQAFPAAVQQMGAYGRDGVNAFAKALDFRNAEQKLSGELRNVENDFSGVQQAVSDTSGSIEDKSAAAVRALWGIAKDGTGPMRKQALADIHALRQQASSDFDAMTAKVTSAASGMRQSIQQGSAQATQDATQNFANLKANITDAMNAGILSASKGSELIAKALNATLKAFGAKPVPVNLQLEQLQSSGATRTMGGQKAYQQVARGAAAGGLFQIGQPGEAGRDSVPLNVGGMPIVVAPGEQVAVFNRHQLPIVNAALAPMGGLPGLFSSVTTPNYMARGGLVGRGFAGGGTLGYGQLEGLWEKGGGPSSVAALAAAIALAESSGRDVMQQGQPWATTGWGYWQITPGGPQYLDPLTNARAAVAKWRGAGDRFTPWTTFNDGAFRQFLKSGVPASMAAGLAGIVAPHVKGGGTIGRLAQAGLDKVARAANAYLGRQSGTGGGAGGPVIGVRHGRYIFPLPAGTWTGGSVDQGWDIAAPGHTPLLALADGTVIGHGISGFGPWAPILRLADGSEVYYGHAGPGHELPIGTRVRAGQQVGEVGAGIVGISTGPHLEIGYYPPGAMGAGAAMKHALGYNLGGLLHLAGGSPDVMSAMLRHQKAPGSPTAIRHGAGYRKPTHTGTRSTSGHKPTKHTVAHGKQKRTAKLPKFKPLPGMDQGLLNQIASLDTSLTDLGNWQSYLTSLHGEIPTEAIVTLADGTQVVNWDGMVDPSTGAFVNGIHQRLAQIGSPGANPNATATRDKNTELGVDELMLDDYLQQGSLAGQLMYGAKGQNRSFGAWLARMKADLANRRQRVRDLTAIVARQQRIKSLIPQQRRDRDAAITARFAQMIHRIQNASAGSTFDASSLLHDQLAGLTKEESKARAAIPTAMPSGWQGSSAAWAAQRGAERAGVTAEFTARRQAIEDAARRHNFQGRLAKSNALFGLHMEESAEKLKLADSFDARSRDLAEKIRRNSGLLTQAKRYVTSDQKNLTDATGNPTGSLAPADVSSSSFYGTLQQYLDPIGTLAINTQTEQNINIPSLLREISSLTGTTVTASSSSSSGANSTLETLQGQQLAQANINNQVLSAQYDALSAALSKMPPFGGFFAEGGIVPGPVGAARTAILHGGERVVPVGGSDGTPIHVHIDRKSDLAHLIDVRIERNNRRTARTVAQGSPSRGGGWLRP